MTKEQVITLLQSCKIKEDEMWYGNEGSYTNRDLFEAKNDAIDNCIDMIESYEE